MTFMEEQTLNEKSSPILTLRLHLRDFLKVYYNILTVILPL